MSKVYTVAIIGCGSRGAFVYGNLMYDQKEKFKIVSLCDIDSIALNTYQSKFFVDKNNCFSSEEEFFKVKRADVLVIGTQDRDHVRMAIKAIRLGYDILLEKPISPLEEELYELRNENKIYNRKILVCHVLRYAPAYIKIKELLDGGEIGKLIRMEALEQVRYAHQAHSFVRGNWRKESETSSMIMQKCCHDLDMIQYYIGARCETVYSNGALAYFKAENQPDGASDRCYDCTYIHSCPYSAENHYVKAWLDDNKPFGWPYNVVDNHNPYTEDTLREAYKNGPYGQCVFKCDNDVVDNQMVAMRFENGVYATLTMTAFTAKGGRIYTFHGANGEIELNESDNYLRLKKYTGTLTPNITEWKISDLVSEQMENSFGHGGGDYMMIERFYEILEGSGTAETSLEKSIESHLIAIKAEESRKLWKELRIHERTMS